MSEEKNELHFSKVIELRDKMMMGCEYGFTIKVVSKKGNVNNMAEFIQKNLNNLFAHRDEILAEFDKCPPLHYERVFSLGQAFEHCNENIKKFLGL